MQNYGQRMLLAPQTADQIISHAGTGSRQDTDSQVQRGNAFVKPLDQQNTAKGYGIERPLRDLYALSEDKNGERRRKYWGKILDGLCRRERHLLQGQEKAKQGRRPKHAAKQQHQMI